MTKNEQAIANLKKLKSVHNGSYGADIDRAIRSIKQDPCEDCVSRQAVDHLCFEFLRANSDDNIAFYEHFRDLPHVTPMQKWIPVSEKMPEEHEWIGTKRFGTTKSNEVYVTFETPKGDRFTKHLSFQNGKLSLADQQTINAFYKGSVPVAWMPLPEPYKAESEE